MLRSLASLSPEQVAEGAALEKPGINAAIIDV